MDYIIRKKDRGFIQNRSKKKLTYVLKRKYPYIYDSMVSEGYSIRFEEYDGLKEILFKNKVVGFLTFDVFSLSALSLKEVFILPRFRGNHLFLECMVRVFASSGIITIVEPTRNLVEILIHYKFADKLTDSLVATAVEFEISPKHRLTNGHDYDEESLISLYDLNLGSPLALKDISTPGVCDIAYSKLQKEDEEKYGCGKFRDSIDISDYFEDVKETLLSNPQFSEKLIELKKNLPKPKFSYNEIIGKGKKLSKIMRDMVEDGVMTQKRAFEIKKQLASEYKNGEVKEDGLSTRLHYLVEGVDLSGDDELFLTNLSKSLALCPSCYQPISLSDSFCRICGYNIEGGKTLNYDEVIADLQANGSGNQKIIDLRGKNMDEFISSLNDEESSPEDESLTESDKPVIYITEDEINQILFEIYEDYDEETFEIFNEDMDLGLSSIDDIAYIEINNTVVLGDSDKQYIKNTYYSKLLLDMYEPVKKHTLGLDYGDWNPYSHQLFEVLSEVDRIHHFDWILSDLDVGKDEMMGILFDNNFIESKNHGSDFWNWVSENNTITQLKDVLRSNGLKVSGNKSDLIERLKDAYLYGEFDDMNFVLTDIGEVALDKLSWVDVFDNSMSFFDFNDFENYLRDNKKDEFRDSAVSYLNEHLKIAYREKDFYHLHDVLSSKAMVYASYNEFKNALMEDLKLFMLRLNPIFLDEDDLDDYKPILSSNIENIYTLADMLNIASLKRIFNKTWGYMKFEKTLVPRKIALNYLNKVLSGSYFEDISYEIVNAYYR